MAAAIAASSRDAVSGFCRPASHLRSTARVSPWCPEQRLRPAACTIHNQASTSAASLMDMTSSMDVDPQGQLPCTSSLLKTPISATNIPDNLTHLTAEHFQNFVDENRENLMVVDYYTTMCGPCKLMGPVFESMAGQFKDVAFAKFDCHKDEHQEEVARRVGVRALPTFHLYRSTPRGTAQLVAAVTGAKAQELKRLICIYRSNRTSRPGDSYWNC